MQKFKHPPTGCASSLTWRGPPTSSNHHTLPPTVQKNKFLHISTHGVGKTLAIGAIAAASVGCILSNADAASLSWDQAGSGALGGTGTWDTSNTNWWDGATDGAWATNTITGDTAVFAGTAGTVTLGVNINALGLTFNTVGYTIATGTNTLTLGTGGIDASGLSSGTTTISGTGALTLGAAQSWNVGSGATLSVSAPVATGGFLLTNSGAGSTNISGVLSGTGGLTQSGSGTLTLSTATNTFSGGLTISGGTLAVDNNLRLGGAGGTAGAVTINGGTLRMNLGSTTQTNTHVITVGASGGTIQVTSTGSNPTYILGNAGNLTGSGNLTVSGNGTLVQAGSPAGAASVFVVNNANAGYTGNVTLTNGAVWEVGNSTAISSSSTYNVNSLGMLSTNSANAIGQAINVNNGGTLAFQNGNTGAFSGTITLTGSTTVRLQDWYQATVRNGLISGNVGGTGSMTINSGSSSGGTLTLSGTNTYGGGTTITSSTAQFTKLVAMPASGAVSVGAGSSLNVNLGGTGEWTTGTSGNGTIGGLLAGLGGQSGGTVSYTGAVTLGLDTTNAGGTQTYSGNIANVGTTLGLNKLGTGTLALSGANTFTGAINVAGGKLTLSNTVGTNTTNANFRVGTVTNTAATLNITSGANITNRFNLFVGDAGAGTGGGAVYQTGGTLTLTQGANQDDIRLGSNANGYGYYKLSGGTLTSNEIGIGGGGQANTLGVMDVTGGTFTDNGYITIARGSGTTSGVLNVTGGTVTAVRIESAWSGNASSVSMLNVGGGAGAATVSTTASTTLGLGLLNSNTAGTTSVANLLTNGTLTVGKVYSNGNANPTALVNFNGGTLKAASTNAGASFLSDANIDAVTVYSGGGTIDNNGTSITIGNALAAPTGTGVTTTTITPTSQGSGYIGAPLVQITGGTTIGGKVATAVANMVDDGTGNGTFKVGSITITSPGDYSAAPTGASFTGGGATSAATLTSLTGFTGTNTSGAMTFQGSGTTTLTGSSTYAGNTTVAMGNTSGLNNAARLNLSFAANQTNIINNTSNSSALILGGSLASNATTVLGGGQLTLTGVATSTNTQQFNGLTVGTGGNNIVFANNATANTIALNVGAITRITGGALHITQPTGTVSSTNGVQTSTGTASTILTDANGTAYATVGGTTAAAGDWAAKDSTNAFIVGGSTIGGFYTTANSAATFTSVGSTGNADITGAFTATAGTDVGSLRMNSAVNLNLGAGTTTIGTGGVLFGVSTNPTISNGTIRAGAGKELVFINTNTGTPQINAVIADSASGASSVTYRALQLTSGNGQFQIGGANTYTGNTYVESGRVAVGTNTSAFGSGGNVFIDGNTNGQVYATGGTFTNHFYIIGNGWNESGGPFGALRLQGATVSGQVTLLGNAAIGAQGGTGTITGIIDDGGNANGLTVIGSTGTVVLTNAETYTGTTTFSSGTLQLGNGGTTGSLSTSSALSFTGGTLAFNRSNAVQQGVDFSGTGITGTTAILTKVGTGTVTLTAANSIKTLNVNNATGAFDIGSGNLTITNAGGSTIQSTTGGTVNATGGGKIVLSQNSTTDGPDIGTANGTTLTINASLTGTSALESWSATSGNNATGVTVLTGANDYTGDTIIHGGVLSVSNVGNSASTTSNLGQGTTIHFGTTTTSTGTLKYTGTGETSNRIIDLQGTTAGGTIDQSGSGLLKFTGTNTATGAGSKTLTLQGSTAGTGEIAGAIVDNSGTNTTSVTKAGTGTWTLSGTNTYTGATTITGGTLKVGGGASISTSSGVTINGSGATLAGAGTVSGIALTSGTIAPGDSGIGTLSGSSLNWTGTSGNNLVFDLSGVDNTSDRLSLSGAFTKGTGTTFAFDFSGGQVGQTYTLASFGSSTFSTGDFSIATAGYTGTFNLDTITTNTLTFTVTSVPEPNEVALSIVGLLGVLIFIRRRNQA